VVGVAERSVGSEREDDVRPELIDDRARGRGDRLSWLLGEMTVAEVQARHVVHAESLS
jgi:hypothetical protein